MSTPTAPTSEPTSAPLNNRWPAQVKFILGNEAAERFSYYGMKAILALYITNVLLQTRDYATTVIHLFGFVNYFMPMIGAWVSDRLWGRYHTILWISLSYCAGHGVMALSDAMQTVDGKLLCLWVGLGLIAFGSGGIKPCVSAFMGDQFQSDQRHLLQKAYAAFYWSINLGSTASFFAIPFIRKSYGYGWAFGVPGLAMALATLVFWLGTRRYVRVKPTGDPKWLWKIYWFFLLVAAVIFTNAFCSGLNMPTGQRVIVNIAGALLVVGWVTQRFLREVDAWTEPRPGAFFAVFWYAMTKPAERKPGGSFWDVCRGRFVDPAIDAARSVLPILGVFALVPVFWALFDQTFSTWVLQGEQMRPHFVSSPTLSDRDIKDVDALAGRAAANAGAQTIFTLLPAATAQSLSDTNLNPDSRRATAANAFNALITTGTLIDTQRLAQVKFGADTRFMIGSALATKSGADASRATRLVLEDTFRDGLSKGYSIGPEEMLSVNPILVMIFIPIMTLLVYPWLGRFASPLRRMAYGMFLAGFSFILVAIFQSQIDGGARLSIYWQTAPYIILTMAEVLVSTTGLEFAFREAAPEMKSTIMGFWNLTIAVGNLLVPFVTTFVGKVIGGAAAQSGDASVTPAMFNFYAALTFVAAIGFSAIAAFYKYRDPLAAQGK